MYVCMYVCMYVFVYVCILQESLILLTTNKYIFTPYIEKVLNCTCYVLVKSEYIEYDYDRAKYKKIYI